MNYFDRFLYKLIIGLVILLSLVTLNKYEVINLNNFKKETSKNINVLNIINKLNGVYELIDLGNSEDITVSKENYVFEMVDGKQKIYTENLNGVSNHCCGVVIKIEFDKTYTITVQGIDGLYYQYENLDTFDHHIYSYLKTNEIIGSCSNYYYLSSWS